MRMYVIRAACLVFFIALGSSAVPDLIWPDPMARGMISGILGGLWVMLAIGIRYPLKMMPIFLFEFVWKMIWLLAFGRPQWLAGTGSPRLSEDLIGIGLFPFVGRAGHPLGLCLASLCRGAVGALALMTPWTLLLLACAGSKSAFEKCS
ncbi:MAG TPA: hypothetical protein VHG29_11390 [Novosphingobium sp.]|nr:hypothetical protein [Novosphingobium sp.]